MGCGPPAIADHSEGNVICRRGFFSFATHGWCVRPRSEELNPLRYDLRALPRAASVLALKFSRLQAAFNVKLSSFAQILCTGFSEFPENHNIVPFHPLLAIAIFPRKALVGRYRKTRDRLSAVGQIPKLGILSQMANARHSIQRHFLSLPVRAASASVIRCCNGRSLQFIQRTPSMFEIVEFHR